MGRKTAIIILLILVLISYGLGFGTAKYFFPTVKTKKVFVPSIKPIPLSEVLKKSKELRLDVEKYDHMW